MENAGVIAIVVGACFYLVSYFLREFLKGGENETERS